MSCITIAQHTLHLLSAKALYVEDLNTLLVSDVHLGKSETFQAHGIPIPNQVNRSTLDRLTALCQTHAVQHLYILGDLFHSRAALTDSVLTEWRQFVQAIAANICLIIGNHDRALIPHLQTLDIEYVCDSIQWGGLLLSHEPECHPVHLNICGHVHPCLKIKTKLDQLRLPCFYWEKSHNRLTLPSFGEFTGGYEVSISTDAIAYVIADDAVIPFP